MKLTFTKMHGIGNDYIYFDCMKSDLPVPPEELAVKLSPRHFSVGADGVVLICRSQAADARMRMFNADGSEGKMCGNAIRCIGKYLYDNGYVTKTEIDVDTLSGVKHLTLYPENGRVARVTVDMGAAERDGRKIPVDHDGIVLDHPLTVDGKDYRVTAVSMGNPHAVTYVDDVAPLPLAEIGPKFENHPFFPERVNTEFIQIVDRNHLKMRVWERGSGETYACGTGACAAAVASVMRGVCDFDTPVAVDLIGGTLTITVSPSFRVTMTGPAATVYEGTIEI